MNNHPEAESLRELQSLVDRLLDEQLSSADCQRLEELICSNQACSDYYVQAMQLTAGLARGAMPPLRLGQLQSENTADLQAEVAALSAQVEALAELALNQKPAAADCDAAALRHDDKKSPTCPPIVLPVDEAAGDTGWPTWIHLPKSFVLFGLTALLLGGVGGWLLSRSMQSTTNDVATSRNGQTLIAGAEPAVAFLTVDNGVIWGGDRPFLRNVGSAVQVGDEIALSEGIAEFRLSSGVYLSLEGPASMVLASPSSLVLQYGKLTAHVPWTVIDFKAIASACRVTACDAEFGLTQDGSKIEVHAFSGEVRAESPQVMREAGAADVSDGGSVVVDDSGIFTKATITTGNSLSLVSDGNVLKVLNVGGKAAPEKFATKLPMAGALPVSQSYVDTVLSSRPLGYWRFESFADGVVRNEIAGGSALKITGKLRLAGRVENSAAELQPGSNCYLTSEPLSSLTRTDYTIEAWIKPSHLHRGIFASLVATNPICASSLELQGAANESLRSRFPGSVRFVHHNPVDGNATMGTSCYSKKRYDARRWQHVVGVKKGSQMRLYVDGQVSASARDRTPLAPPRWLMVGWDSLNPGRNFVGQIDEVAIYDRALAAEEVMQHYEAVEWRPEQKPPHQNDDA